MCAPACITWGACLCTCVHVCEYMLAYAAQSCSLKRALAPTAGSFAWEATTKTTKQWTTTPYIYIYSYTMFSLIQYIYIYYLHTDEYSRCMDKWLETQACPRRAHDTFCALCCSSMFGAARLGTYSIFGCSLCSYYAHTMLEIRLPLWLRRLDWKMEARKELPRACDPYSV